MASGVSICCAVQVNTLGRPGKVTGQEVAELASRESRPRVLREFLRQVNGYPTLPVHLALTTYPPSPIYPPLSKYPLHVDRLAIRSALASCRLMRCLGGGQSITLCFRLTLCVRRTHDMTHPLYASSLNSCQIAVANPLFYSVSALLIIPLIENGTSLNPCTSLLFSFCVIFRLFAPRHCVDCSQLHDATHHTTPRHTL